MTQKSLLLSKKHMALRQDYEALCVAYREVLHLEDQLAGLFCKISESEDISKATLENFDEINHRVAASYRAMRSRKIGRLLKKLVQHDTQHLNKAAMQALTPSERRSTLIINDYYIAYHEHTNLKKLQNLVSKVLHAEDAWSNITDKTTFDEFLPHLEGVFTPTLKAAERYAATHSKTYGRLSTYGSMIQDYDGDFNSANVARLINRFEFPYYKVRDTIIRQQRSESRLWGSYIEPQGPFPVPAQHELSQFLLDVFELPNARLVASKSPMAMLVGATSHIFTSYRPNPFFSTHSTLHELAHGAYDQNALGGKSLDQRQAIDSARGMVLHEACALLTEYSIGNSMDFCHWFAPHAARILGHEGDPAFTPRNVWMHLNRVRLGTVRFAADELTYPTHILMREKLERRLANRSLSIKDLETAWNEASKEMLGAVPQNAKQGCLQNGHWVSGTFGYFPLYLIGLMVQAQLHYAMRRDLPNYSATIRAGQFKPISGWLNEHVHRHGQYYTTQQLVRRATGEGIRPEYLLAYYREKFLGAPYERLRREYELGIKVPAGRVVGLMLD